MTVLDTSLLRPARSGALGLSRETAFRWLGIGAIVVLAAALRFTNLAALGYANHYYAAGIAAMLQSWHNFFFVAAEPGGSVTIDKPPVGLWLQTASAYVFGVNGFGLLLPQILAGLLSVVVLYHLVRRSFGTAAGLIAALVLAVTPVVVATDRNNTIDSTLILTLLLAAWAFVKATETARLRWLLLGAVLVGIGFNIKMLQAFLPLPAFFALYFLGAPERWWTKLWKLTVAGLLLLAISLSWAIAVDLTPADQRPYVGSSEDNSVMSLIVGHNGLRRLVGMRPQGSFLGGLLGGTQAANGQPAAGQAPRVDGPTRPPAGQGPRVDGPQQPPAGVPPTGGTPQGRPAAGPGGGGPGGFMIGSPGALRLFVQPLSKEASWLLPFSILGAVLLLFRARPRWPLGPKHQALVLWGGWLLLGAGFFSVASFFHEYYLSLLAPALGALVGIAAIELWRMPGRWSWLAKLLLVVVAAGTLAFQLYTARAFLPSLWWQPIAIGVLALGAALVLASLFLRRPLVTVSGFVAVLAALLITPTIWSGFTTLYASGNQSLPAAYSGRPSGPANRGNVQVNQALLDYLQANTQDVKFLMAVPSSMQGADYVLATGRPVLYLGGFSGQDPVVSAADLARLVADGELRYVYWSGGRGGPGGGNAEITSWVTSACTPVTGFETSTQNAGAPDGTLPGGNAPPGQGFGAIQVLLYECR